MNPVAPVTRTSSGRESVMVPPLQSDRCSESKHRIVAGMTGQGGGTYARGMSADRTRASYHHGSLRETLVRACLDLIRAEGIGAVSLRRVAREAGVSPGAPYHHFADRAALL